ncbi:MAG TPA: hypothetical protein VHX37_14895 [Acidobacteriaceae bacterium]|nr:hypothetical protein [Acidobacteriaceae bacterium]
MSFVVAEPGGVPQWDSSAYDPSGAVNAKAADSDHDPRTLFRRSQRTPCGQDFLAASFLARHPRFDSQKPLREDMKGNPWARFHGGEHAPASSVVAAARQGTKSRISVPPVTCS